MSNTHPKYTIKEGDTIQRITDLFCVMKKFYVLLLLICSCFIIAEAQSHIQLGDYPGADCHNSLGTYMIVNAKGEEVVPPMYVHIEKLKKGFGYYTGYAKARADYKYSIIDSLGNFLSPQLYDDIAFFDPDGFSPVMMNDKWGFINGNFEIVVPCEYNNCKVFKDKSLVFVRKQIEKQFFWGAVNPTTGKEIIPYVYGNVLDFDGNYVIVRLDGLYGLLSAKGDTILPLEYEKIEFNDDRFNPGITAIRVNDKKYGLLNTEGFIFEPVYDGIFPGANLAEIRKDGKAAFINKSGELVTPFIYYGGIPCKNGGGAIVSGLESISEDGYIDSLGVMKLKGTDYHELNDKGIYQYRQNSSFLYYDYAGNLKPDEDTAPILAVAEVKDAGIDNTIINNGKKYALGDSEGKPLTPYAYTDISRLGRSGKIYKVTKDKQSGLVNYLGEEVLPCQYDPQSFLYLDNGVIILKKGERYGFADAETGKLLVPCRYTEINNNFKEITTVRNGNYMGVVDRTGKEIIPSDIYEYVRIFNKEKVIVARKGKFLGMIDHDNNVLLPFEYDIIEPYYGDMMIVAEGVSCN